MDFMKICNDSTKENKVALVTGTQSFTYRRLDKLSDGVAASLQANGETSRGVIVACERPENFVISMLAAMKLNKFFVPVSKETCTTAVLKELAGMLTVNDLITDFPCQAGVLSHVNIEKAIVHDSKMKIDYEKCQKLTNSSTAYAVLTSGSTGKPKVVEVSQDNIAYATKARSSYYGDSIQSILPLLEFSFDAGIGYALWALTQGVTLSMLSAKQAKNPNIVANFIKSNNIKMLSLTPTKYNMLLPILEDQNARSILDTVITGGETLDQKLVERHQKSLPGVALYNEYGPTESTVWSSVFPVYMRDWAQNKPRNYSNIIGARLTTDTDLIVCNKHRLPLPLGARGELYISGGQVSKGYTGNNKLNKQRFSNHSFFGEKKRRTFKTDDWVHIDQNKQLVYDYRAGAEQKIEGHRVSLLEIESILLRSDVIENAKVLAEYNNEAWLLVAYIVAKDQSGAKEEIHNFVNANSVTTVPITYRIIKQMPITCNGKIDINALSTVPCTPISMTDIPETSSGSLYMSLMNLWADLLKLDKEPIQLQKNLYYYGMNSVLIPKACSVLSDTFGVSISIPEFVENMTVEKQIKLIEAKQQDSQSLESILITGVTGFLGIHLLHDFLENTNATVYCLVRSNTYKMAKLSGVAEQFGLSEMLTDCRVKLIQGDFEKINLGMQLDKYYQLAEKIDTVIHAGANVNHVLPYDPLYKSNVLGTDNIISFCLKQKKKKLHFVSTLSPACMNEKWPDHTTEVDHKLSNYQRSKYEAEYHVYQAISQQQLEASVYRPGWITGSTKNGQFLCPERDHMLCLLAACARLGYAPAYDTVINLLPVDTVSSAITSMTKLSNKSSAVFNIFHPKGISWNTLIAILSSVLDLDIKTIPVAEWLLKLQNDMLLPGNPLAPFKAYYADEKYTPYGNDENFVPSMKNTIAALNNADFKIPHITRELIVSYIQANARLFHSMSAEDNALESFYNFL